MLRYTFEISYHLFFLSFVPFSHKDSISHPYTNFQKATVSLLLLLLSKGQGSLKYLTVGQLKEEGIHPHQNNP